MAPEIVLLPCLCVISDARALVHNSEPTLLSSADRRMARAQLSKHCPRNIALIHNLVEETHLTEAETSPDEGFSSHLDRLSLTKKD